MRKKTSITYDLHSTLLSMLLQRDHEKNSSRKLPFQVLLHSTNQLNIVEERKPEYHLIQSHESTDEILSMIKINYLRISVAVTIVAMFVTGLRIAATLKISGCCPIACPARKPPCEPPQIPTLDELIPLNEERTRFVN